MAKFEIEKDQEPDRMYVMVDDKFDVQIVRTDEGLVVDIYPWDGNEAVASTYAFDGDVESSAIPGRGHALPLWRMWTPFPISTGRSKAWPRSRSTATRSQ